MAKSSEDTNYSEGKILPRVLEKEMKSSYLDYAMSVIVGRALPDVRDGMKPVHRRILYAMYELGNTHDKPYKKSARVVGETLGKYHPHGDAAIYDSLVRMAQDFSMRYPLIDGQGNFGSIDGDAPAAMRYTEVRLNKFAEEMLADIDKETVDFLPNFDATLKEPNVLPAKLPNLLINGSSGIAVGMATNMPPHNLGEICDALVALIDKPDADFNLIRSIVQGPDFPTGGIIVGKRGINEAYSTGKGSIKIRGKAEIVKNKDGKSQQIVITALPYQVNKADFVKSVAELARDKKIDGIADISDRSDKDGMEIVIDLKKDANAEIVLNQLYAHTTLESTFGIINLALVNNQPKILTLIELLQEFIAHRKEILKRRSLFELKVAKDRKHVVEGLLLAVNRIEEIIKIVKTSSSPINDLKSRFELSEKQAEAILEMKIRKLSALEANKLIEEDKELTKKIEYLSQVLSDEKKLYQIIKLEIEDIKGRYSDKRLTEIAEDEEEVDIEDLIADEQVAVIITKDGYIKRVPIDEYKSQGRGGKGIIGAETKEEDQIKDIMLASTHDYLLFFTDKGNVHWLKVYKIPAGSRYSMGKAIVNLLELSNEKISAWIKTKEFKPEEYLVMLTRNGIVKRTSMAEYSRPRKGGIIGITIREGDALIDAKKTDGKRDLIIATSQGYAIRFSEKEVREIGRTGQGVKGIKLGANDTVVGMELDENETLLTVTENGYGKRTNISEYREQSRGGKGVINIKTHGRNGKVVGIAAVKDGDEILIASSGKRIIRIPVKDISVIGRNTSGVRLMKLEEGEKIIAVEKLHIGNNASENLSADSQSNFVA